MTTKPPDIIDATPRIGEVGGAQLDYFPNPLSNRTFKLNPLAPPGAVLEAALQAIAHCLTRDDALIRECLALRERVAALEQLLVDATATPEPVELDLAALQTKTAAPEGDRGPDAASNEG